MRISTNMPSKLRNQILLTDDEIGRAFVLWNYAQSIVEHELELCNCALTDGGNGFCYLGSWVEGCLPTEEVIPDIDAEELENLSATFFMFDAIKQLSVLRGSEN